MAQGANVSFAINPESADELHNPEGKVRCCNITVLGGRGGGNPFVGVISSKTEKYGPMFFLTPS